MSTEGKRSVRGVRIEDLSLRVLSTDRPCTMDHRDSMHWTKYPTRPPLMRRTSLILPSPDRFSPLTTPTTVHPTPCGLSSLTAMDLAEPRPGGLAALAGESAEAAPREPPPPRRDRTDEPPDRVRGGGATGGDLSSEWEV